MSPLMSYTNVRSTGRINLKLTLYSWNVNGIRAVERKGFVDWLNQTAPDVMCIQETKAHKEQLSKQLQEPEGYFTVWDEAEKKGYSGTVIYSAFEPIATSNGIPDKIRNKYNLTDEAGRESDKEGRVVTMEFDDFYVVSVYTPNAKDSLERLKLRYQGWDPAFLDYVSELKKKKSVIFCGDLNVAHTEDDLARPQENIGKKGFTDEERAGLQNYIDAGFVDTYRLFHKGNGKYTWWTQWGNTRERNVGWRIDYFFVSDDLKDKVIAAEIHDDVMGSDHAPISLILEI